MANPIFVAITSSGSGNSWDIFYIACMHYTHKDFYKIRPSSLRRIIKYILKELKSVINTGSKEQLDIIANELKYSADSLIELYICNQDAVEKSSDINNYAEDILLLIADEKLCEQIALTSPDTAIKFFEAMTKNKKYPISIFKFARNLSIAFLLNKNSAQYHELSGYISGLRGYLKPLSKAMYGDYQLMESLKCPLQIYDTHAISATRTEISRPIHDSPLDIGYDTIDSMDAEQFKAYTSLTLITVENYLSENEELPYSRAISSIFVSIRHPCGSLDQLKDVLGLEIHW